MYLIESVVIAPFRREPFFFRIPNG